MRLISFSITNFKGIEHLKLDLRNNSDSKVYTLVGLNESGKTTLLEAMNHFAYKEESLAALELEGYEIDDMHNIIPINQRDNFNGAITIEASFEYENKEEKALITKTLQKETGLDITEVGKTVEFYQKYSFKDSQYLKDASTHFWRHGFRGKGKTESKTRSLRNSEALKVIDLIKERLPSILYFPNFLFEFPERIYLEDTVIDPKNKFYQNIIQDILDALDNDLKIKAHLSDRMLSEDQNQKRQLNSVLGKMNKILTDVIFKSWNKIFGKQIMDKEILLYPGKDEKGIYLEFNIKDSVDTYRITERSLGFRWFFVFLLLTQFRCFRKKSKEALFLLDEPASNLHPSAQMQLLKSFEKLSKVIYTTHSHYLVNPQWLENTYVVKNEALDYDKEDDYNAKKTKITIHKYRDFASKHPDQTSYFQPILEVLDYVPSNLEMVPNVILTEGKSDYYILAYYQRILKNISDPIAIVPGTGSTNLQTLISLYLGWGRKFFLLLDSDEEGRKQRNRYLEMYGQSLSDRILLYSDIDEAWADMEIEKLFSDDDKLAIQLLSYPESSSFQKKLFNKSIQELLITGKKINISEVSENNLAKVIAFLSTKLNSNI